MPPTTEGQHPKVSVVITFRDAADTLEQTLRSLETQTFSDWEAILVDDGSSDASPAIAAAWAARDPRFRPIASGGTGRGPALNLGVAASRGEHIAILDADDEFHPRKLELQVTALETRPELAVLATGQFVTDLTPDSFASRKPDPNARVAPITPRRLCRGNPVCHSSVLMRPSALSAVGGYSETLARQLDYDLWIRLAEGGHRMAVLSDLLTLKRVHAGQKFATDKPLRYSLSSARMQMGAIRRLGGSPLDYLIAVGRLAARMAPRQARVAIRRQRRQ